MAIEKFEKVEIISHTSSRDMLVEELQTEGLVEIIDISTYKKAVETQGDVSERIRRVEFLLGILEGYDKKAKGMLKNLFQEKLAVSKEEIKNTVDSFDHKKVYEDCSFFAGQLEKLNSKENNLNVIRGNILPWSGLRLSYKEIKGTGKVAFVIGTVSSGKFLSFEKAVRGNPSVFMKVINRTKTFAYCLLGFMRADEPKAGAFLSGLGFQTITLPPLPYELEDVKFEECLSRIDAELAKIREEKEVSVKRIKEFLPLLSSAKVVYDYLNNLRCREKADELFCETETTFTVCGWVKRRDIAALRRLIGEKFHEAELIISKQGSSDIPPVSLRNNRFVEPFEVVVDLYGLPNSRETDPTPLLAPFFVIFFGLCLTDAGYGAVLSILAYLGLRKFKGGMTGKLLKLLLFSGIVTVFLGLLTGGVFGLEIKAAKVFMLIDPMKDFLIFMMISIGVGFIQVWSGFLINMLKELRKGVAKEQVLLKGLSWLVFLPGVMILGITKQPEMISLGLLTKSPLGDVWGNIALIVTLAGVCGIFFEAGMGRKGILKRAFLGLYGVYGIIGCFGDILSYVRLFALGLATVAMAIAVNTIGDFVRGVPVFGSILLTVFFIGGHLINLFINVLSGFIHTLRLQFVEFFTKFYEGGGRAFQPFVKEGRYTVAVSGN